MRGRISKTVRFEKKTVSWNLSSRSLVDRTKVSGELSLFILMPEEYVVRKN
jgi:hypothetical protein